MGTNELFIVKHFLRKGANPINDGNPESSPAIQSYVNSLFRNRWHLSLNKLYTINLSKLPNPTVYEVPRGSLLREIVNKKIMKEIESYARYASKADDNIFMASFKFLKKGKTISQIYVETTNVEASLELKEFLNTEKPFFENLFKRIKKDQIYCDFKVRF
jgi:hypothetical protein